MSTAVLPPAAPPAPPFKNRRGWIIAFGVAEILIGCLVLAMIGLAAVGMRLARASVQQPATDTRFLIIIAVFYGAIAAFFVAVGIGNTQVKRWARLVMLIISWAWLAMGVLGTAIMALAIPTIMKSAEQTAAQPMPASFNTIFNVVMFGFLGLFFIVLPLIFVAFYSGKNVKATYEHASAASSDVGSLARKPISVLVAAGWFALGVFGYLFVFAMPIFPLFGLVLRGWQARIVATVFEVVYVWLTLNLYRQRMLAWKVAIGIILFGWLSFLVTVMRTGVMDMYRGMGYSEVQLTQMAGMLKYSLAFGAVMAVGFLVMLIVTRKYYSDSAATA